MKNNFIFAAKNWADFEQLKNLGAKNIIVGSQNFSRLGEFSNEELHQVIDVALKNEIKLQIEFDLLPTQKQFVELIEQWKQQNFSTKFPIRVLDMGLMEWLSENNYRLIPLLEAGFHNKNAIGNVHKDFGEKIEHYVLSKELTFERQLDYQNKILEQRSIELAFFSPILLFYSPRKLLNMYLEEQNQETPYLQLNAASQESAHKGFVVRENKFGTLFFHTKYQSLIQKFDLFKDNSEVLLNIDLRLVEDNQIRQNCITGLLQEIHPPEEFPFETTRGFFDVNKTDVLFPKLKNQHRQHLQYRYVGEVMDVVKGDSLIVNVATGEQLTRGDELYLQSPQGEDGKVSLSKLTDLTGSDLNQSSVNLNLVKINYLKNFPSKTAVFKIQEN